jgi:hypothetical protein
LGRRTIGERGIVGERRTVEKRVCNYANCEPQESVNYNGG